MMTLPGRRSSTVQKAKDEPTASQAAAREIPTSTLPYEIGTGGSDTGVEIVCRTQRRPPFTKHIRRTFQIYVHGFQPGTEVSVAGKFRNHVTRMHEGWQIMILNFLCTGITRTHWQSSITNSSAFKVVSAGCRILIRMSLGVEAIPAVVSTQKATASKTTLS